jgi:peptide chain release factor subunit 1
MRSDRFRSLLSHDGPFASVYFDDSHDTEDAAAQRELRWRAIREQLEDRGVDDRLCTELQHAVLDGPPPVGRGGRALVAATDGVIVDEPLLRGPSAPVVRASTLPYLVPFVEHGLEHPAYLVVAVDHAGADITVHRQGRITRRSVDGGGYPVHKASSAETSGYGDPQLRTDEAARKNVRAAAEEITAIIDQSAVDVIFIVGEVRARNDLQTVLPERLADRVVTLHDGARTSLDDQQLRHDIDAYFLERRVAAIDDAAQRFTAELGRDSGLATEGLPGVCAALRDGAVETLIIGELADRTVVMGETLAAIAPNADVLSELGAAPTETVRADEALPLLAVSTDAELIRTDERIDPADGVAAVLRYARRG